MKRIKKEKSYTAYYFPVVVWREDLDELCEILSGGQMRITSGDYQFDSISDAAEHFGKRSQCDLTLSSTKPYAQVQFSRNEAVVYVGGDEKSAGQFNELNEVLTRCQRRFPYIYSFWICVAVGLLAVADLKLGLSHREGLSPISFFLALVSIWIIFLFFIRTWHHSVIKFQRRSESLPFLVRNRDQILLMVISAVVGGLITFAGTQIKDRIFPSAQIGAPKGSD